MARNRPYEKFRPRMKRSWPSAHYPSDQAKAPPIHWRFRVRQAIRPQPPDSGWPARQNILKVRPVPLRAEPREDVRGTYGDGSRRFFRDSAGRCTFGKCEVRARERYGSHDRSRSLSGIHLQARANSRAQNLPRGASDRRIAPNSRIRRRNDSACAETIAEPLGTHLLGNGGPSCKQLLGRIHCSP